MTKWQRLKAKLYLFFHADLPMFLEGRSLFTKVSFGCLGVILAKLMLLALAFAFIIGFAWIMSLLNSNKTYPLLHPAEEIAGISIVQFSEEVSRFRSSKGEVPGTLLQSTIATIPVGENRIAECIEALEDLPASRWWNDPVDKIDQVALLISYQDGSMEWISHSGCYQYTPGADDSHWTWYFFDQDVFYDFLQQFGYEPDT